MFLAVLEQFTSESRSVNTSGGATYAPTVFARHVGSEGVAKAGFRRAMDGLLSSGQIYIKTEGPPSKRRSFLALGPRPEADCEACDMDELATHPGGEARWPQLAIKARNGGRHVGRWPGGGHRGGFPTPFQLLSTLKGRASNPVPSPLPTLFQPISNPLCSTPYTLKSIDGPPLGAGGLSLMREEGL